MSSSLKILRRYCYDPLDRLSSAGPSEGTSTQRFYQGDHLVTEREERSQRTIIRHEAQPLAQQRSMAGETETTLLATDQTHSLLRTVEQQLAFTAYGYHPAESGLSRLIGFNGECPDAITGHYLLGQGTRAFNPVLMRFNSPDELSPFGKGGINSYAYCGGDPINFSDPTGNVRFRPWNFPRPNRFQPWKSKGLDLSSNTGFSSNRPASRLLATTAPAQTLEETNIFSIIPPEHAPKKSHLRAPKRTKQNEKSVANARNKRNNAREFDDLMRNNPSLQSRVKPMLTDYAQAFEAAKINRETLVAQKVDYKRIRNLDMRLQHKRQMVKGDILLRLEQEASAIRSPPAETIST